VPEPRPRRGGEVLASTFNLQYIGDLPLADINRVIPLLFADSKVFITNAARKHVQEVHPDAYSAYLPILPDLVEHPMYVGLYPQKDFAIQLVTDLRIRGEHVLVGVRLHSMTDPRKRNTISSFYRLDDPTFRNRLESMHLKPIPYGLDKKQLAAHNTRTGF